MSERDFLIYTADKKKTGVPFDLVKAGDPKGKI